MQLKYGIQDGNAIGSHLQHCKKSQLRVRQSEENVRERDSMLGLSRRPSSVNV